MMSLDRLSEISIEHTDENGVTHFDGYCIDSEEGAVMAYGINGEVYYCDPDYRELPLMIDAVKDYINTFKSK